MGAEREAEAGDTALDLHVILQRMVHDFQECRSRQHTERLKLEKELSALQNARGTRQERRETIRSTLQSLKRELQDLDREDDANNSQEVQLKSEYNLMTEKWEQAQERWSTTLLSMVRLSSHQNRPPASSLFV